MTVFGVKSNNTNSTFQFPFGISHDAMQYFRSSRASKPEPSLPDALAELRELLVERELTVVPPPGESHTALLTRFLVARKLNVSKAADFLAADQAWRRDEKVDELREASAGEILKCDPALFHAVLPHTLPAVAVDRKGRPVIIKHFGAQCVLRSMRKHTEVECLCRYNWWLNEQYHTQLITLGATKWSVIVDAKGWYPGLFDKTACEPSTHKQPHPTPPHPAPPASSNEKSACEAYKDAYGDTRRDTHGDAHAEQLPEKHVDKLGKCCRKSLLTKCASQRSCARASRALLSWQTHSSRAPPPSTSNTTPNASPT